MLHLIFAVHDSCSGVYDRPFPSRSENEAVRSFSDIALDAEHPIGKHPEHYSLWRIATYDDNAGKMEGCAPVHIIGAMDCVSKSRQIEPDSLRNNDPAGFVRDGKSNGDFEVTLGESDA